jgi:hypothetical protein
MLSTLKELRQDFFQKARLAGIDTSSIVNADVDKLLNEAQMELCDAGQFRVVTLTTDLVAGQSDYVVDAGVTKFLSVSVNGLPLDQTSITALTEYHPGWESFSSGDPRKWYPKGGEEFGLFPSPAVGTTGGISLVACVVPPEMTLLQGPIIPVSIRPALIKFAIGTVKQSREQGGEAELQAFATLKNRLERRSASPDGKSTKIRVVEEWL